jgi:RNA polymerase sigma factor (sigma-70 family)
METPEGPSDAELIARVRNGDLEAYGELFGRHHHAAERMARQLVPANDADDLASDAFAKVLEALRGGGGPDLSFRAYLLTTVRRVHVDRIRSGRKVTATDDIASYERQPETFDDPTVTGFESGAAAKAFASLPERWQAVLWHTEVEGEKPAAIAPLLGMTANGVSALAYRAREGLRQAYLQQHLADVAGDRCRWTTERLGAYVRGGLTKRENHNVREHLDGCAKCTAVYLELVEVNSALPALLAPALLGTAGLGYLAAASGAKVGFVGFLVTGWRKATENSTRTAISAGAVVVIVAAVIAAFALTGGQSPPAAIKPPAPSQQPTQPPGTPPTVNPPTVKPPTAKPPTTQPTTQPTQPQPTTAPTSAPTTTQPTTPPPAVPTTPILDEALLTISAPQGGGGVPSGFGPATRAQTLAAPAATEQWLITLKVPANNTKPVTIGLKYGAAVHWPMSSNPSGWTCTRAADGKGVSCTATNPRAPQMLPVTFANATGGSVVDRTFTVSAKTGRLYDDDSATLAAPPSPPKPPTTDENLLKISVRKPDPDVHFRTLTVAPGSGRSKVTLNITYGASLSWPISSNPTGWKCSPAAKTCTANNPAQPAPLNADFAVPQGGSAAARTYSVTATAGSVHDTDSETLAGIQLDESLLHIITPDLRHDPNPLVYNRFLQISGPTTGRVTLELSWGGHLIFLPTWDKGWTCWRSTDIRRATCWTDNYSKPLNSEWLAFYPGSGSANQLTVKASVGGRYDADYVQIPPSSARR